MFTAGPPLGTPPGPPSSLGWVRESETPEALLKRLVDAVPPEPKDAEAHDRFGKPTPIEFLPPVDGAGMGRAPEIERSIKFPDKQQDEEDQKEPDKPVFEFREVKRKTTTKRIENPNDSQQYVMVEVIDEIVFDGLGAYWRYSPNNGGSE